MEGWWWCVSEECVWCLGVMLEYHTVGKKSGFEKTSA